ncbi:MAG: OB-fold domain-containing protein [Thermodesulfobacteriota bacterium]|nr:OB-fold domain-containing protein [Thermodesulfobacteriota bacterium]
MLTQKNGSTAQSIEEQIDPRLKPLIKMPKSPSERPHLIGNNCTFCKECFFPKRVLCPNCLKEEGLEDVLLSYTGTLYTYCIVKAAPLGFSAPYAIGYVDLPEGLRIFSPLAVDDARELQVGMDLELFVDKIREDEAGKAVYGYIFKPFST